MKIGKYKKAMRPKKYLTHDFIVYKAEPEDEFGSPNTWNTKVDDYLQERGYYKEKKDEREDV